MPAYYVMLEGTGINIPDVPKPITGFFAARRVTAVNADAAGEKAKTLIKREWSQKEYIEANLGSQPDLEIKEIQKLNILLTAFTRTPKKGFTFY